MITYQIFEGQDSGPPIHHYTTTSEDTAADYIDSRRNAYASAGLPCCPWFYEQHPTTT
jgi:hypothetical protein